MMTRSILARTQILKIPVTTALLASILTNSSLCYAARTKSTVHIMQNGFYHGNEIAFPFGIEHGWLGLEVNNNEAHLQMLSPKIDRVQDAIVDQAGQASTYTGKEVSVAGATPLLYIKANWIKPGQVQQARIVGNAEFEFANARFKLNHRCTNSLDANNLKSCKVTFSDGKKEQFIANTKESPNGELNDSASTVKVVWAGDIDRDGKIDLILSTSFENGESTQLFLSSQATHQELAKAVAIVTRLGC